MCWMSAPESGGIAKESHIGDPKEDYIIIALNNP